MSRAVKKVSTGHSGSSQSTVPLWLLSSSFIPTHVGNRSSFSFLVFAFTVHPHVRGEQLLTQPTCWPKDGSSPRAWGTGSRGNGPSSATRFIPTCVGNSLLVCKFVVLSTVHPHVRGEQITSPRLLELSCGSSPRAWGTASSKSLRCLKARFIPTCVGNRLVPMLAKASSAVHPHVRGEQVEGVHRARRDGGSSPRAWGTGLAWRAAGLLRRFIPTCVGNRSSTIGSCGRLAVHPHVRGEQGSGGSEGKGNFGSSPRAWGTG